MIRCDRCGAVLAVWRLVQPALPNEPHRALLVCPNRACENGRSGQVLQQVLLQPGGGQEKEQRK